MRLNKRYMLITLFVLGLGFAGCAPEGNRQRGAGAGSGGDPGNWGRPVQMHGRDEPAIQMYYETPLKGKAIERAGSAGAIGP